MNSLRKIFSLGATFVLSSLFMSGAANAAPSNDDAILMSVNGSDYVSETTTPILMSLNPDNSGEPSVIVPGDVLKGALTVKNNGPDKGVLKAYLVDVKNNGPDDLTMDDWFSGDVQIKANGKNGSLVQWDFENGSAQRIGSSEHYGIEILETNLDKNAIADVELEVEFPVESISGNSAGSNASPNGIPNNYSPGERSSSFDIYLTLQGDTETENPSPTTKPTATPDTNDPTDKPSVSPTETPNSDDSKDNVDEAVNGDDDNGNPGNTNQNPNNNNNNNESRPDRVTTGAEIISSPLGIAGIIGFFGIAIGIIILILNRDKKLEKLDKEVEK